MATKTLCSALSWAPNTQYNAGERVANDSPTKVYECVTGGMSASSGGPTGTGSGITDGAAVWDYVVTPDYTLFSDAESGTEDPVGDTTSYTIEVYHNGTNGGAYTGSWVIQGASATSSNATYNRTWTVPSGERHDGTFANDGTCVVVDNTTSLVINFRDEHSCTFEWFVIEKTDVAGYFIIGTSSSGSGCTDLTISHCIIKGPTGTSTCEGFEPNNAGDTGQLQVCLIYDAVESAVRLKDVAFDVLACTLVDNNTDNDSFRGGVDGNAKTFTATNVAAIANATFDWDDIGSATATYCADSDGTLPVGSGNQRNKARADCFNLSTADDFTVKAAGPLDGNGTPITGISTDLAGNSFDGTNPSIGCYEVVSSGQSVTGVSAAVTVTATTGTVQLGGGPAPVTAAGTGGALGVTGSAGAVTVTATTGTAAIIVAATGSPAPVTVAATSGTVQLTGAPATVSVSVPAGGVGTSTSASVTVTATTGLVGVHGAPAQISVGASTGGVLAGTVGSPATITVTVTTGTVVAPIVVSGVAASVTVTVTTGAVGGGAILLVGTILHFYDQNAAGPLPCVVTKHDSGDLYNVSVWGDDSVGSSRHAQSVTLQPDLATGIAAGEAFVLDALP